MRPIRNNWLVGWGLVGTMLWVGFTGCSDIGGVNVTNTIGGSAGSGTHTGGDGGTPASGARNDTSHAGAMAGTPTAGTAAAGTAAAGTGAVNGGGEGGTLSDAGAGGASAGQGGAGEPGVVYGVPALGGNCEHEAALACSGVAQKGKLICYQGSWAPNGSCATTERCARTNGDCAPYVAECNGKPAGRLVCSGDDEVKCSGDATVTSRTVSGCAVAAAGAGGAG